MTETKCDACLGSIHHPASFAVMVEVRNNQKLADDPDKPMSALKTEFLDICPNCIQKFNIRISRPIR